jgi:hypothetical protein
MLCLLVCCAFTLAPHLPADAGESRDWGVNLNANFDYSVLGNWVDLSNKFRRWGNVNSPWQQQTFTLPFTDQGVPREDFGTVFVHGGDPLGIYQFRYEGAADVRFNGHGGIVPGSMRTAGGVTTMDVDMNSNGNTWINFRNVDPDDPVRNIRMISPGYDIDTTQMFRQEFTRRLAPFSTLRYMDWSLTNNSEVTSWSDRRLPGETSQAYDFTRPEKGGVAWEHVIRLSNETRTNAWINVPHQADDDYVRNLARLWRDEFDPSLTLYVEWSNEPWNAGFAQSRNTGWNYSLEGNAASQIARVGSIFKEEFGDEADERLNVVLGAWSANTFSARKALEYFDANNLTPSETIDSIAIAPYMKFPRGEQFTNLDDVFAALEQRTDDIVNHAAIAEQNGLELIAYEAGQHLVPNISATSEALLFAAQHDPRMAQAYRDFAQAWEDNGGGLVMHYALAAEDSRFGSWSLLNNMRRPGDVKWDAVMGLLLSEGDATLEGHVTYEDFVVLKENYGQSDRWWEQGDFDADNTVGPADFLAMYGNLEGLTPEQENEILEFAVIHGIDVGSTLADLTRNGFVDFQDLTLLLANWNTMGHLADGNLVDPAGSVIDFADLTALLAEWGPAAAGAPEATSGAEAVPEPSSVVLAMTALLVLGVGACRRRRS